MKTFSRVAEVKTNEKKSCTSLFLVLKPGKLKKKIQFFYLNSFINYFLYRKFFTFCHANAKKLSHFRLTVFFSNPVERFRGPTIQRMFVVRLYSKLIVLGFAQCLLGQLYAFCLAIQTGGRQRFWLFVLLGFQ